MKNSIYGLMMVLSVAICGGGIDSGSKAQTIVGLIMFAVFAGGIIVESAIEDVKTYNKRGHNCNINDYPCFFRK